MCVCGRVCVWLCVPLFVSVPPELKWVQHSTFSGIHLFLSDTFWRLRSQNCPTQSETRILILKPQSLSSFVHLCHANFVFLGLFPSSFASFHRRFAAHLRCYHPAGFNCGLHLQVRSGPNPGRRRSRVGSPGSTPCAGDVVNFVN